jgi:hypothetical protein
MAKNTIIDGIAASEHLDSSGESLSIQGMDISSLGGPDSILNWEHGSKDRPSQVVGKVTFAKKILKESDAKTKREKYFWNKVKKPMVYIKAELFDGVGHSGAQDVAAMLRYNNKDKGDDSRLVVGFSIEGGKMEKKGMVVTKSIARDVAITVKPCNKVCDAELIEDEVDEDFLYKNQEFDCEIINNGGLSLKKGFRESILEDVKKSLPSMKNFNANADKLKDTKSFQTKGQVSEAIAKESSKPLTLKQDAKAKRRFDPNPNPTGVFTKETAPENLKVGNKIVYKPNKMKTGKDIYNDPETWNSDSKKNSMRMSEKNNMRKALIAGMMGGTPDSKTGGAALAQEDLDPDMKKVSKLKKKIKKNEPLDLNPKIKEKKHKEFVQKLDQKLQGMKNRSEEEKFKDKPFTPQEARIAMARMKNKKGDRRNQQGTIADRKTSGLIEEKRTQQRNRGDLERRNQQGTIADRKNTKDVWGEENKRTRVEDRTQKPKEGLNYTNKRLRVMNKSEVGKMLYGVRINPEHGKKIAQAYHEMKHTPNDKMTQEAYSALINETRDQFQKLMDGGLKISRIQPGQENPYKNSKELHEDIVNNNHLWYFPTDQGYGSGEEILDHPLLQGTGYMHDDKELLANDMFRIVHDINGHHIGGQSGFGPKGEHKAFLTHRSMYSPLAQKALASETLGQNSWVNFGPYGEQNRANPSQTIYADQKAGLLPDEIVYGDWHIDNDLNEN